MLLFRVPVFDGPIPQSAAWRCAAFSLLCCAAGLAAAGAQAPMNPSSEDPYRVQRRQMVQDIRRLYRVTGLEQRLGSAARSEARPAVWAEVLAVMQQVPRHLFVPPRLLPMAYRDRALPIGSGQTISQPFIVALMTRLALGGELRLAEVLEIGTGSGYQAAVLSGLAERVYSIEIVEELGNSARRHLQELGYDNVRVRIGDGYRGWPEQAPFDAVLVTAAPDHLPPALLEQLKPGGRLVIPVGPRGGQQSLRVVRRGADGGHFTEDLLPVSFVPLTGEAEDTEDTLEH